MSILIRNRTFLGRYVETQLNDSPRCQQHHILEYTVVPIREAFSVGSLNTRVIIVSAVSVLDGSVIVDSLIWFRYFVLFFYFCLLIDWLIGCFDWLIDWSIDRSIDWLIDCFICLCIYSVIVSISTCRGTRWGRDTLVQFLHLCKKSLFMGI